jgi:hypothetical protein
MLGGKLVVDDGDAPPVKSSQVRLGRPCGFALALVVTVSLLCSPVPWPPSRPPESPSLLGPVVAGGVSLDGAMAGVAA